MLHDKKKLQNRINATWGTGEPREPEEHGEEAARAPPTDRFLLASKNPL